MLQLIITCQDMLVETLCSQLEEHNALSITLTDQYDDPILEPTTGSNPLWPHVIIHALFENEAQAKEVITALSNHYPGLSITSEIIPEQDWTKHVMDTFQPQRFGDRLLVYPSWHTPLEQDAIHVVLDPGLAFGTGAHATTALCLTWLESHDLSQTTVIDYGCGSGILAISALKLGASHAYAIDIDEQALLATRNNARNNHILDHTLTIGNVDLSPAQADLLIANILLTPLIALKTHFHALIKPQGFLVVSGILNEQIDTLINEYQSHFTHVTTQTQGDWALLTFQPIFSFDMIDIR